MVAPLNSPQPIFELPPLSTIPDEYEDSPVPGVYPVRQNMGLSMNFAHHHIVDRTK